MERIPASERTRERLKALMEGRSEIGGWPLGARAAGGAADHRGSAGRRSEGRVGRDYYARGAVPAPGIATAIGRVG